MNAGLPATDISVGCGSAQHTLHWADGVLTAVDHPDAERERALIALGADPYPCLELLDLWNRHADDLDVLVLASRSASDVLVTADTHHHGSYSALGTSGWTSYAPRRYAHFQGGGPPPADHFRGGPQRLLTTPGLADPLVSTVLAHWIERVALGDERVAASAPRLHAAVYGRLAVPLRSWLGRPGVRVHLELVGPDDERVLSPDGPDVVRVRLPLAWLSEVWSTGLTTVLGRFCLGVTAVGPEQWQLDLVDHDLTTMRTAQLTF